MGEETKGFSLDELKERDGRNGAAAWIAHAGSVYDVSESERWKEGTHMRRHKAGADLTVEIKGAPHGPEVLERITRLGALKPVKDPMDERVPDLLLRVLDRVPMLRRHPHPMTVHFPLAFCMTVPLFNLLFLFTDQPSFETTAYYMLVLSLLGTTVAAATGPYTWWLNYGAVMNSNIRIKLGMSAALFLLVLTGFLWRSVHPGVLYAPGAPHVVYFLLTCMYPLLVSVLGWIGAKMTFPH